jgi:hypothetical protein
MMGRGDGISVKHARGGTSMQGAGASPRVERSALALPAFITVNDVNRGDQMAARDMSRITALAHQHAILRRTRPGQPHSHGFPRASWYR